MAGSGVTVILPSTILLLCTVWDKSIDCYELCHVTSTESFSFFSHRKEIPFTKTLEVLHLENHFINLVDEATKPTGIEEGQHNSVEH